MCLCYRNSITNRIPFRRIWRIIRGVSYSARRHDSDHQRIHFKAVLGAYTISYKITPPTICRGRNFILNGTFPKRMYASDILSEAYIYTRYYR